MNIAGVELFDLRPSGGADNVVVNDLAGAGLGQLIADLANDGAADVVEIKGSSAANELRVNGGISISGIGAAVNVRRAQAANDKLNLDAGAGSDRVVVEGTRKRHDRRGSVGCSPNVAVAGGRRAAGRRGSAEALAIGSLAGNDTLNAGLGARAHPADAGRRSQQRRHQRWRRQRHAARRERKLTRSTETEAPTTLMDAGDDSFTWDPRRRQRQGGRRGRQRHDGLQRRRSR